MAGKERITAERLRELMTYDPETGIFIWKTSGGRGPTSHRSGEVINQAPTSDGYLRIVISGVAYGLHRLAFLYMRGRYPAHEIDHRDLNRSNNCWSNLREATHSQNQANKRGYSRSRSRLKGVTWRPERQQWRSRLFKDGKNHYLGLFNCPAAAHFAYVVAADIHHGEFARAT